MILVYILFKMKIILYVRCYRLDPDPRKKVFDPECQKSTDPTGSSSLTMWLLDILTKGGKRGDDFLVNEAESNLNIFFTPHLSRKI